MKHSGRNSTLENFERNARATAAPNQAALRLSGFSSQRTNSYRANATVAAQAMSLVARAACPRTGGRQTNRAKAITAAGGPNQRQPHANTTAHPRRKKGRLPRRASSTFFTKSPLEYRIALPSSYGEERMEWLRSPLKYGPSAAATRANGGCCSSYV